MLNGRGYSTASAILRSRKHEWFIRTRQGSSLLICAMPIFSQWKCVARRSGAEAARRTVRNRSDGFFGFLCYNGIEVKKLKVNTSKSKNAESFYIKQSYIDSNGKSTSRTIRKLGTLKELLVEHSPTRDDVIAWAKEQARIETEKFEQEKANHCIPITFHPNRKIAHGEKRKFQGGYLFLQSLYYELGLNKVCRKIRDKHHYDYDLNAILSDLIYTRILEPGSKRSSFETAKNFLEAPTYQLHDVYGS